MALIKCGECGKEISTLAPACPSCGAPRAAAGGNKDQNPKAVVVYETTSNAGVLTGILGSFFAILGIFTLGWLFLPFAVLFSTISLLSGIFRLSANGGVMAVVSCVLTLIGFATSPVATLAALALLGHVIGTVNDGGPSVTQSSPNRSVDAVVDDILKTRDSKLKTLQEGRQTTGMPGATEQQSIAPVHDCDRIAANPTDMRRYPALPGVQFKELRDNLNAALTACAAAVSAYPKEMRFKYQLARGLQMRDKKAALTIFQELAALSYPAAFDNLGWLSISESNDYPKAIEYFQAGYALGDADCAVSLYEMIDRDKWTVPNPAAMKIELLEKAAAGSHAGAIVALPIERAKQAAAQFPMLSADQPMQPSYAADPACTGPPYGSTFAEYKAFVETIGKKIWETEARAQVFLAAICEAKLSHAPKPLEPLHNLGVSNAEVDAMTMSELRWRAMREVKIRVDQLEK